jgi:hypothetical protein
MVPSMLRLAQEVITSRKETIPASPKNKSPATTQTPAPAPLPVSISVSAPTKSKPLTSDLPASEFVVENLSGINIISSDAGTVYVDRALIGEWKELYGDKNIEYATIEDVSTRKRLRCKFQPIKNEKLDGQNVVLVPNRIQAKLEIKKGATVRIRPVIEDGEQKHE